MVWKQKITNTDQHQKSWAFPGLFHVVVVDLSNDCFDNYDQQPKTSFSLTNMNFGHFIFQ